MQRFFILLLFVSLCLVLIIAPLQNPTPTSAMTVGNIIIDTLIDVTGDCSQFHLETTWVNGAGNTDDNGPVDYVHIVIYDGTGRPVLIDDFQWSSLVPPYNGSALIDEIKPFAATQRPFVLKVHDTTFTGFSPLNDILNAPVIFSQIFDPAAIAGGTNCGNLPLGTVTDYVPIDCDQRLNITDCHNAPIAIYGGDYLHLYAIDLPTSRGILVLNLAMDELRAVEPPIREWSRLIQAVDNPTSGFPIEIYRLGNGDIQINTYYATGKAYIFAWNPDDESSGYHVMH